MVEISVVIVTYNSAPFFEALISALEKQTLLPQRIIIVDSGSKDTGYLERVHTSPLNFRLALKDNIGVCVGNNLGWSQSRDADYVLFLNPDAFLTPDFLEKGIEYLEDPANLSVGIVQPTLIQYDISTKQSTGCVDSTGVSQSWYGRFFERDQGKLLEVLAQHTAPNSVPAVCSAVALCRQQSLVDIAEGDNLFDPEFFMYKDDTDVSLRVRRMGWKLMHHPGLVAYHCRGWKGRAATSRKMRLLSSRNDIRLYAKTRSPYLIYAFAKHAAVLLFNL